MAQDHKPNLDRLASAPDLPASFSPAQPAAQPLSIMQRLPLQGPHIQLTALEDTDLTALLPFFQDLSVLRYYLPTTARPLNRIQLERLLKDWNDGVENYVFAIRSSGKTCGIFNLDGLDWANGHAEIGIAITDKLIRGQGLASEALSVMLDYAFNELGMHRLWCRIIDGNDPSTRLFEKTGFRREGRLRHHVLRSGAYRDMLIYGLLKSDWQTPFSPVQEQGR